MSYNKFTSTLKIINLVAVFNFFSLLFLICAAELISGHVILTGSIEPSKDLEANILLIGNEKVTIIFSTEQTSPLSEYLNISLVNPQKKEFAWRKEFSGSKSGGTKHSESFSFTPEASGMHNIRISYTRIPTEEKIGSRIHYIKDQHYISQIEVKIISGMITPTQSPYYFPIFAASFIIMTAGHFLPLLTKAKKRLRISLEEINNIFIAFCLSLIIVYIIVFL